MRNTSILEKKPLLSTLTIPSLVAALAALSGCSASDNAGGTGGFAGFGATGVGAGASNGTGNVLIGGGGIPSGTGGGLIGGNTGSGGGGTSVPPDPVGPEGPPSENACTEAAKFGGAAAGGKLLYPYEGTIFPRGLPGPLLMWDQQSEQILLEMKSAKWSYTACPATPDGIRYQIPKDIWRRASSYSDGTGDPLNVKITTFAGGRAAGSISLNVSFALASLKGAIYYNTYGAALGQPSLSNGNGAVMKITPGEEQPTLFLTDTGVQPFGPCRSCHALSANGMTMTANHHLYPGVYESESYDVSGPKPTMLKNGLVEAGFAGIFPDGSRMMTNGPPKVSASAFFPTAPGNVTALLQGTARLLDPKTGTEIPSQGWDAPHAQMPMFSPNGDMIVYNDYDKGEGHSLFVASFNPATNTFSGQKQIYTDANTYASWPFFTPDSKKVIFTTDTRADYSSQVPDPVLATASLTPTGRGHLMIVDVATGQATKLDLANGYKGGQSYLPAGVGRDNELEFFPTGSPLAAGGFFWAFFTSRRTYGNLSTQDLENPVTKKLWAAAIDIGATPGTDPSHPAFLLPGQELTTGNLRAFAALEPCKEDGQACTVGSDCCSGFCSVDPATGKGICGKQVTCPKLGDKCSQDSDCCTGKDNGVNGRTLLCLGGFCDQKLVQ